VPVAEKRPVRIAPNDPEAAGLWDDLGRLAARVLPADWTLIGGLMVQLHAYEAGEMGVRATTDIDILGDARKRKAIERIARTRESSPGLAGQSFRATTHRRSQLLGRLSSPRTSRSNPTIPGSWNR
jgi:hypothetical protein